MSLFLLSIERNQQLKIEAEKKFKVRKNIRITCI